jgi:hypothetical protein
MVFEDIRDVSEILFATPPYEEFHLLTGGFTYSRVWGTG